MRLAMLKEILFGCLFLGGIAFAGARVTLDLPDAVGALAPCQTGYRGPVPGSCTRPLPPRQLPAEAATPHDLAAADPHLEGACRGI